MEKMTKINKIFLTYEQQIEMLQEKGLIIKDTDYAIQLLKQHSYFALVSGYKSPFKNKTGEYKLHTTIEDIYRLYEFDEKLRELFLRNILKVEKHVKSLISYTFCKVYGENQSHYLNVTNYNYSNGLQVEINQLVNKLSSIEQNPSQYLYIKHQKHKYGNVPLWVMVKALTLGTISKMYSVQTYNVQTQISKEFPFVHETMLANMIDILSRVRNVCAHNERLFDYQYKNKKIDDTAVHTILKIKKDKRGFSKGKSDLFAAIIALKYTIKEEDFNCMIDELEVLLTELCDNTQNLQQNQMYKYMGFPENWKEIKNCLKVESIS
ncbi:MAG: Abi family protein [Eubacteriales bacterium]